ncbi:MAG: undecaprenyl-phosphate glucose phosphotransferase [Lachnospiraceae bacterium]|nr:undecaprenyl-phosphate glucose phosphotransferase [Lachnospiraceae bacterium]
MIRDNQVHFNRLHVVIDAFVIILSYVLAWNFHFHILTGHRPVGGLSVQTYMSALLFLVPEFLILYSMFNLYTPKRVQGRRLEASNVFLANVVGIMIFIFVLYMIHEEHFSRRMLFLFTGINIVLSVVERNMIRMVLMRLRAKGMNLKHIILVGYSKAAEAFIDRVKANPQWGYQINGILDDKAGPGTSYRNVEVIGTISELGTILNRNMQDEIAITLGLDEYTKLQSIVAACEKSGVHTKFIPDYNNIIPTRPYTEDLLGLPVVNIRHVPLTNTFNRVIKRIVDIVGSLFCIVLFSPLMLLTAALIKITSPGPLIFSQVRVGLHNRTFKMYKFRSMEVQTEKEEKKGWTTRDDPRVTPVGKFIRKTSIDEMPQFFNVLVGDMSLVGPRPERPQYVEKFREEIPRYMVKHQVRPGMTGWAQVNGFRGNTSIRKRIEHDIYYIENWSMGLDLKILVLTVFKGFINKNAY